MNLTEYLGSAQAIEDVRALLVQPLNERGTRWLNRESPVNGWVQREGAPWCTISLLYAEPNNWRPSLECYYRKTGFGSFLMSDRGETACEIVGRTGISFETALGMMRAIICGGATLTATDDGLFVPNEMYRTTSEPDNLPAALVSVLSAVAKCAEVK